MKLQLAGPHIRAIGKSLPLASAQAESVGIMKFSGEGVRLIRQILADISPEQAATCPRCFTDGIQLLIDGGCPVAHRDVAGLPWADVDTPDDLRFVRQHLSLFLAGASSAYVAGYREGRA